MNYVTVWSNDENQRRVVEEVAFMCIDQMMPKFSTLDICIDLTDDDCEEDGYCLQVGKRRFEILIDPKLEGDDLITAVAHEMVHVKQYARNEIKEEDKLLPYFDRPYEIEAYKKQEELLAVYHN